MIVRPDPTLLASTLPRVDAPRVELPRADAPSAGGATPGVDFAERVRDFVGHVNEAQVSAEQVADGYANGSHNDLHGTMIALEQADITLRFASNIRNRLIEAYREVMRMGA